MQTRSKSTGGAQSVVDEIVAAGGRGLALSCDVSSREDVEAMVGQIISDRGRIDILVNNAGVPSEAGSAIYCASLVRQQH
ncbi:SDR family NAD(P)-dependent oxidoreductase [Novosphingobium aquae]|uniref:SDR family NAD(P)-dependent oxidoreductase n=1 Tax=Novosphingobium aquae TaxID=3133435 RepID=A0ABU8S6F1_9SPHN